MKLIVAFIRPEKLAAVEAALDRSEVSLVTVGQAVDCRDGQTVTHRGSELRMPTPTLRLEIAVQDSFLEAALEAIVEAAGCVGDKGTIGHGRVFVTGLVECVPVPKTGVWPARTPVPEGPPPPFFSRRFEHVS